MTTTLVNRDDFQMHPESGTSPLAMSCESASDHLLLEAVRDGSEAAFAELVSRYRNQLTNYLYRLLGDYEMAVDLSQESFIRVYRARDRYQSSHAFSTYIYRIATNLAISEMRRRKRRRLISLSTFFSNGKNQNETSTAFDVPDERPLPDANLISRERQAAVQAAINTLPDKYRVPLVLRDIEGRTYEDIATLLDMNVGTIKSRISRARNFLREKLEGYL